MGKKRRAQIDKTNSGEDPEQGRIRAWLGRRKQAIRDKVDDALDNATAQAQYKHYKRWMEGSGCNTPRFIKWDDPQISLEAKLCDPRNLRLIRKGRHRDEFFSICSEEEIDIYLNRVGENGERYTDLEDPHILRDMVRGVKQAWRDLKKERGEEMTPEEEEALNTFFADEEDETETREETT